MKSKLFLGVSVLCTFLVSLFMVNFMASGIDAAGFTQIGTTLHYASPFISLAALFVPYEYGLARITFTQGLCEKIQRRLIDVYKKNTPSIKRSKVGYLEALVSDRNMSGVELIPIDQGNGKKREVRLKYTQRGCDDDITNTPVEGCATEIEKEPFEQTVAVNEYTGTKGMKFSEEEMRKLCEPDSEWMAEIVRGQMDALFVNLNKDLIAIQSANFGEFNPDVLPNEKTVNLLYGDRNDPLPYGESVILEDMEDVDASSRPILIGSGKLGHYVRAIGIGCCNDGGQNIAEAGNFDFYRDRFVEGVLGADHFIAMLPGHVQLVTYNKYKGSYRKENDVFSHGTIVDPFTGLELDMKWHYDDCDDFYSLHFGLFWELVFLPTNAFAYCDPLVGVNGTFHYIAAHQPA